jgi:D-ribose pyranose/furanose isomerase RbsD
MGFLSKINKKLGFSKGTKERVRALKRREALGLNPKYVEDPMGPIMSPSGRFNQSALDRRVAEMTALNPGMNFGDQIGYTRPNKDPSMPIAFDDPSFRMPQKRGGGFGNLGEAIRRLQEKRGGDMGMPRRPSMPGMGSPGGTPGFYDNMRENMSPGQRLEQRPNFGMEQMPTARRDPSALERLPTGGAPSFNPTIFGQPIPQGADFSNMPDFSQIDMSQLDLSGIPQSISQMNLPQMPEGLPSIEEIQGNRRMPEMDRGRMQPRMMMAEGDEVFMPSNPNQIAFSIETEIKNLMNEYEMAANNGEIERAQMVAEQINELEARRIQAMNEAKTMENLENENFEGSTLSDITIQEMLRNKNKMVYGGEMKGYANGGEIENMLSGMDSGEEEAMGELEQMAPEMEMIDQLVMMVAQMIQQGAGEEQVISFLREQGLDDEDIGTVLQLVSEMAETEEVAAQNEIGADLEQLG